MNFLKKVCTSEVKIGFWRICEIPD